MAKPPTQWATTCTFTNLPFNSIILSITAHQEHEKLKFLQHNLTVDSVQLHSPNLPLGISYLPISLIVKQLEELEGCNLG